MTARAWPLAAVLLLAACTSGAYTPATITASPAWPAGWVLPDHALTPGAIATTDTSRLCPHVDPALEAARPGSAEKDRVYAAYHIASHPAGVYEVDHLVPIELGGDPSSMANLWPELNDAVDPSVVKAQGLSLAFTHNSKDALETVLHRDVCAGQVPLSVAQQAIASDWRLAFLKYIGKP